MADEYPVLQRDASQMKVWLEILQPLPTFTPFLDLDKGPDFHVVADFTTIKIGEIKDADAFAEFYGGRDFLQGLRC